MQLQNYTCKLVSKIAILFFLPSGGDKSKFLRVIKKSTAFRSIISKWMKLNSVFNSTLAHANANKHSIP